MFAPSPNKKKQQQPKPTEVKQEVAKPVEKQVKIRVGGIRLRTKGVTDHGALTGLADDDHIQYLLLNKKMRLGVYHFSPTLVPTNPNQAVGWADYITASVLIVTSKVRITGLGILVIVGGGVGALVNMGIYDSNSLAQPVNLLAQVQNIDASADATWIEGAVDVTLERGLYFLAWLTNNNNVSVWDFACVATPLGLSASGWSLGKWYVPYAFAALPATFPAGADVDIGSIAVAIKVASIT